MEDRIQGQKKKRALPDFLNQSVTNLYFNNEIFDESNLKLLAQLHHSKIRKYSLVSTL